MEGFKVENKEILSIEQVIDDEARELKQESGSRFRNACVAAALALSTGACTTMSVGGSVERIGGDTHAEWKDTTKEGNYKKLCTEISNHLDQPGVQRYTSTHVYRDGQYKLRGTELSDGRKLTIEVIGPDGTVYDCR